MDEGSLMHWQSEIHKWNLDVIAELKKINEATSKWFETLDVFPEARTGCEFPDGYPDILKAFHMHLLAMHDARVARLGDMVKERWGKLPE